LTSDAPALRDTLRIRARELIPALRRRAVEAEELRHLPPATIADLRAAGLHKIFTPRRYGGHEADWGAHSDVADELAQGCGSTGWVSSVVCSHTWILGRFPKEAQDDAFGARPDCIVATGAQGGSRAEAVPGGYRISGMWRFCSGSVHADYAIVGAVLGSERDRPGNTAPRLMCILDRSQIEIVDNWYAAGLKGTGSHDLKVTDQFVPGHRTALASDIAGANPPGAAANDSYIYRVEMTPYFMTLLLGPIIGAAKGGFRDYVEMTKPRRGQNYGEAVIEQTHVQAAVAQSASDIRAAELMGQAILRVLHERGRAGLPIDGAIRAELRRDLAYLAKLGRDAVDRLSAMMGASGQTGHNPVHRHYRDITAMTAHGGIAWDRATAY
jgi:3-hydroxy-9,10-secoandrosta-1,3,5(10)-triene-9,17-dione monooxygenase